MHLPAVVKALIAPSCWTRDCRARWRGCPPVARHAPGPDLIIENGISGLLCGTVPELAAALDKTTAAMGHAAQSRVNENFLWQNSAELALTLLPKKGKANG